MLIYCDRVDETHRKASMPASFHRLTSCSLAIVCLVGGISSAVRGESPSPVLTSIFPPGGKTGTTFEVAVQGAALDGAIAIDSACPGLTFKLIEKNRFA